MRVVFVQPYEEFALGVRVLSSFLKTRGHEVYRVFVKTNTELNRWAEILAAEGAEDVGPRAFFAHPCRVTTREMDFLLGKLADLRPEIVGLSVTSNIAHLGKFLSRRIREDLGVPVIWGGIDPTLHPDKAIEVADFVCVGEGEYAMAELLEALADGQREPEIDGIWTRRADGTVYRGKIRPLIQDLDSIPIGDWDPTVESYIIADQMGPGFPPPAYSPVHCEVPLMTQRGCPFACSYCAYSLVRKFYPRQKFVRRRSVQHVLDELHMLKRRFPRVGRFFFWDDVFTLHPLWLDEFSERYPREIGVPFGIFTHAQFCQRRRLEPLAKAGMIETRIGIQSGSERTLRECYNRRVSADQMLKAAHEIHDLGVGLTVDLIAFNPLETEEDYRATIDLLLKLPRPFVLSPIFPLIFFDGLPLTEMALRKGVALSRPAGSGHRYEQVVTPEMRFWAAVMELPAYDLDCEKIVRPLIEDRYLREHPEILENLCTALCSMTFVDGRGGDVFKDRYIADLEKRVADLEKQLTWWHERARRPLLRKVLDRILGR